MSRLEDGGCPVDVSLDDVPTQLFSCCHRGFYVDGSATLPLVGVRHRDSLTHHVSGERVVGLIENSEAHPADGDGVPVPRFGDGFGRLNGDPNRITRLFGCGDGAEFGDDSRKH